MPLPIANGTLSLQSSAIQTAPKRAMIVRMTEETLKALEAYPAHPQMEFDFGEKPGVHIGSTFFPMGPVTPELAPHELYLRSAPANKPNAPLKLYATITGKLQVGRELDTAIEDKVRESTIEAAKAKNGRRIVRLTSPPATAAPAKTKATAAAAKKRKAPSNGFPTVVTKRVTQVIQAKNEGSRGVSPLPPPRTNPEDFTTSRSRMIHCLALSHRTADEIVRLIAGPDSTPAARKQMLDLLEDVAMQVSPPKKAASSPSPPKYQLKLSSWTEVRPYGWTKLTDAERTTLARQARIVFEQLKIPESDPRWDHVRYRALGASATAPSSGNSTPSGRAAASKPDTKRAVSGDSKGKASASASTASKSRDDSLRVPSSSAARAKKDELPSRPSRPSLKRERDADDEALPSPSTSTSTSAVAQRRLPGSGTKSVRDSPAASSGPGTPSAASSQTKKAGVAEIRMKKENGAGTPTGRSGLSASAAQRERDREREKERGRDLSRDMPPPPKRIKEESRERERDRESSTASATGSIKRKKPTQGYRDDVDDELEEAIGLGGSASSSVGTKRRKMDDGSIAGKKARDKDPDAKEKTAPASAPPRKVPANANGNAAAKTKEREIKRERDVTPLPLPKKPLAARDRPRESPIPRKVKREPSPTPPPRAAERAREQQREREYERAKPKTNGSSRRRRSPIYTDSEDETTATPPARAANGRPSNHTHNPPSSSATSSSTSSPDAAGLTMSVGLESVPTRLPPSGPLPRDHRALRQRYRASYREYVKTYHAIVAQRAKIEDALDVEGDAASVCDGELMLEDEIISLRNVHAKWKEDCVRILKVWRGAADDAY